MSQQGDIFNKCEQNTGLFADIKEILAQYRKLPGLSGANGPHMQCNGQPVINWSSNDYLGFTNHPSNRDIERLSIDEIPANSPMGSRFLSNHSAFEELESRFAAYTECEDAILFATGYLAALGAISTLVGPKDVILIDSEAHSCLFDSAKLASANGAYYKVFKHNDMKSLEDLLRFVRQQTGAGILIMMDGVYSMKGDLAKLNEIVALKNKYGARLFLDDAHGGGVMGKEGKGTAHHFNLHQEVDLVMHVFSKAFGSIGGCIVGKKSVIDYLRMNAKTYIFSHNMQLVFIRKTLNSLDLIQSDPGHLDSLWKNTLYLQSELKKYGFNIGTTQSPITPIIINVTNRQIAVEYLFRLICTLRDEHHIFVSGVTYPAVPSNIALIRLIPTSQHTYKDIDDTVEAFVQVTHQLKSA